MSVSYFVLTVFAAICQKGLSDAFLTQHILTISCEILAKPCSPLHRSGQNITPEITQGKFHWKMPLTIHDDF